MGAHRQLRSSPQPYAGAAHRTRPEQEPPVFAQRLDPALVTTFSLALGPIIVVLVLLLFPGAGGSDSYSPAESTKPVIQVLPRPTTEVAPAPGGTGR